MGASTTPASRPGDSPDEAQVVAGHRAPGKLGRERRVGSRALGEDDQAGRALVQAVDDARPAGPAHPRQAWRMGQRGGGERALGLAGSGVCHHPRGLVHDQKVIVLQHDAEGDGLRGQPLRGRRRDLCLETFAPAQPMRRLRGPAVDAHRSRVDQGLEAHARQIGQTGGEPLVEARSCCLRSGLRGPAPGGVAGCAHPRGAAGASMLRARSATPTVMAESATLKAGQ